MDSSNNTRLTYGLIFLGLLYFGSAVEKKIAEAQIENDYLQSTIDEMQERLNKIEDKLGL